MSPRLRLALLLLVALVAVGAALPGSAASSNERPSLQQLEKEVMCPTCNSTLELSHAPIADRIRAFIVERIDAGDSSSEIKDKLVLQFGERILAAPTKSGFNLIAWVLPFVGLAVAAVIVLVVLRRWRRARGRGASSDDAAAIEPAVERRIDEELARLDR
ncbi:MAG: cytochrome c-type biogenesis protein [Gaiellaceae bacterium]